MLPARRPLVLLTATVRPNTRLNVSLTDPDVRLQQYQAAFRDWAAIADRLDFGLLIVETSGEPFDVLLKEVPESHVGRIDLVHHTPAPESIERGKGHMEWGAIRTGLGHIGTPDASRTIFKVTGRLVVTNPEQCMGELQQHSARLRMRIDGTLADTRLLGATYEVWRDHLLPCAEDIDLQQGIDIEHAVGANLTRARLLKQVRIDPFPERPLFLGESAFDGKRMRPGLTRLKSLMLRPVERAVSAAASAIGH